MRLRVLLLPLVVAVLSGCALFPPKQTTLTDHIASNALSVAVDQIGAPYEWGGRGPSSFDCSGLIVWAYKQAYPSLKFALGSRVVNDATMDTMWRYNVERLLLDDVRPGDIVFITNSSTTITHGGLFVRWVDDDMTEFEFVNASSYYGETVLDTWPVEGEKRGQWLVGIGRLKTTL